MDEDWFTLSIKINNNIVFLDKEHYVVVSYVYSVIR